MSKALLDISSARLAIQIINNGVLTPLNQLKELTAEFAVKNAYIQFLTQNISL